MSTQTLTFDTTATAMQMAETMFGAGVEVVSASYTGDARSSAIYQNGAAAGDVVPADSGVILSTGLATNFAGPNDSGSTGTNTAGVNGDKILNAVAGVPTYDAAILECSFIPTGDTLTMQLTFGSEEYLEWVNAGFNDAVAITVNGQPATLTIGDGEISIDNINTTSNANLFRDNADGSFSTEMDGITVILTVKAPVIPGQVNTLRIAIADAGDSIYDSNLLIVADSIQTALIANDDIVSVSALGTTTVNLLANDTVTGLDGVEITRINDIPVQVGDTITLVTGETIRLLDGGRIEITGGTAEALNTLSYTIASDDGTTDTGFVTIGTSPVDGTAGHDKIFVGFTDAQGNIVDGADGLSDVIHGYGGNDNIRAGDGDDILHGGDGNDMLDGGAGADMMYGGTGNDVYFIDDLGDVVSEAGGNGHDIVKSDHSHALGQGFEELWLNEVATALEAIGNAADNKLVGNGFDNRIEGGDGRDQLYGGGGDDILDGGAGNDRIDGEAGADLLLGGLGDDKMDGGTGDDRLEGGAGRDVLIGGAGQDILVGGTGNDVLYGNGDGDTFVFALGDGQDVVKGFDFATDRLVLSGVDAGDISVRAWGAGMLIEYGDAGDRIVLSQTDFATFDMGAIVFDTLIL
ncbi:choice-of-anchor L domain-containing protein [Roseicyclus persicicus]|uniref:Calcium-binding protein n=1 Tax=Roseicyclus persicicus TaxID=2650661 RepID=A0A7X6JXN2_9RHOB|nr:choice-of-anchor L domain-containing protein [Roseibacterium persicicum]NKX43574.1 calcium-binding protein [Roseibacterium persicicum]